MWQGKRAITMGRGSRCEDLQNLLRENLTFKSSKMHESACL